MSIDAAIWAALRGDPRYPATKRAIDRWLESIAENAEREHPMLRMLKKKGEQ